MTKKQAFRGIAFILATALLILIMCDIFEYTSSHISERYEAFIDLPEDTVDAVYIGSSAVDRYWIPSKAFDDYGMTVYPLSTDMQPSWLVKTMTEEAYRHQNPQLVIIDIRSFCTDPSEHLTDMDVASRRVIDMLGFFSRGRQDAIARTLDAMQEIDPDASAHDPSYFLSFIRYHSRWEHEPMSIDDLLDPPSPYLGFFMDKKLSLGRVMLPETSFSDVREPLDDISEYYLYELLDYLKSNDINALFVDSPHTKTYEEVTKTNTLLDILEREGFDYIDYNTEENWAKYPYVTYREGAEGDFYNDGHTNYNGALKYTTYFSAYLDENYNLPDRREDAGCACWHDVTDAISEQISQWRKAQGQ